MTDQDLLFQAAHALITAYDCIDGEDEKAVAEKAINALLDRLADVDPLQSDEWKPYRREQ